MTASLGAQPAPARKPPVLHVVEAYGGGVMNVIHDYIDATPEYEHYILCSARPEHDTGSVAGLDPSHILRLPRNPVAAIRRVGQVVRELQPAIVHAHSSKAGAYVRLSPSVPTRSIYYTPHCFAFERLDIRSATRRAFRLTERALVRRTRHFVAVSARELELAQELRRRAAGTYVPNIATVPPFMVRDTPRSRTVATIGRVSDQKDPQFFIDVVRASAAAGSADIRWLWLGDGPDRLVDPLKDAGVEVSGWLPRDEVLSQLNAATVYLHTASWEGSPLSVLEAAALGLPMVVRETPASVSLGLDDLVETPQAAAEAVRRACSSDGRAARHDRFLARHTPEVQRSTLRRAYGLTAPVPATPRPAADAAERAGAPAQRGTHIAG